MLKKGFFVFFLTALAPFISLAESINITIRGIQPTIGELRITLIENKVQFKQYVSKSDADPKPKLGKIIKVTDNIMKLKFENIPFQNKVWAIAYYHDANCNGELDKSFFWKIPEEGFGFSRDPSGLPPEFEDTKFEIEGTKNIEMNITYLSDTPTNPEFCN
ncbi:MAG: DUF2141 domain-containing protein [Alphaproteobacteria bacterium]|nr:DUF2141 domain-containing protein [Alphaproteobacteria bacterium]